MKYKNKDTFKKRTNKNLFFEVMKKANLNYESNNFITNLMNRLLANKEKNLQKILTEIKKLNN